MTPHPLLHTAAALMLSCLLLGACDDEDTRKNNTDAPKRVSAMTVMPQSVALTPKIPGRVVAYRMAEIRPQVDGIITQRLFEEGSYVTQGQQLFQIDPARYEADYDMAAASVQTARAELNRAEALLKRYKKLIGSNAISQQELDNARAGAEQARAAVAQSKAEMRMARINLDYTKVYAPISGYIGPTEFTEGALVTAQQAETLATIRQLDTVYVDLSQPDQSSSELNTALLEARRDPNSPKLSVELLVNNEPYPHPGIVDAAEQAIDPDTGALRIRAQFPNPDTVLLPGMFVEAQINPAEQAEAILVPQKNVTILPGGEKAVWVIGKENTAEKRNVTIRRSQGNQWVIESGLSAGDRLITEGTMQLQEGQAVTTEEQNQENAQARRNEE